MSWVCPGEGRTPQEVEESLELNIPAILPSGAKEQISQAIKLSVEGLKSGVVGDGPYKVILSGHSKQGNGDLYGNSISIGIHSKA